jgi:hypothetical protein
VIEARLYEKDGFLTFGGDAPRSAAGLEELRASLIA